MSDLALQSRGSRFFLGQIEILGIISASAIVVLMLATVTDVTVRWITSASVPGMFEIAESALVVAVFFGLPWAALRGEHVSVSLLTDRLTGRWSRIVNVVMWVLCVVTLAWLTYATIGRAIESSMMREARFGLIQWPLYPLRWIIAFGLAQWLVLALVNLARVVRGRRAYGDIP
ncbi:MAG TPA: TRAP transporter small permease [Microbacteriaceae bacterium]|nr:TRAP transporter small permease [Microbacteriaceae bacterium]